MITTAVELKDRLRRELRDDFGILLSDDDLNGFLLDAVRDYTIFGKGFVGTYEIVGNSSGLLRLPTDYLHSIRADRPDGNDLPFILSKHLRECVGFRGHRCDFCHGICVSSDGFGILRLYPIVPVGTVVGTLHYVRVGTLDDLPKCDFDALYHHVLFQLGVIYSKTTLSRHYGEFLSIVNDEKRSKHHLGNRSKVRFGRYY